MGLRAQQCYLHKNDLCSAKEISEIYHVPKEIMAKTMQKLCKKGYLGAVKGSHGGYYLNVNLNEINLTDFIENIEGPLALDDHKTQFLITSLDRSASS